MKGLAHRGQAVGSRLASVVHCANVLVARIAWNLNLIVLHDVLLDDCLPLLLAFTLPNSTWVDVSLGEEAAVAREVIRHFSRAHPAALSAS